MNRILNTFALVLLPGLSQAHALEVDDAPRPDAFALVHDGRAAAVLVDPDEPAVVREVAAAAFADDVERVTGVKPALHEAQRWNGQPAVIIGTLGHSDLIAQLRHAGHLEVDDLEGQWESFKIVVLAATDPDTAQALVIVGSDRRGTAFGVFEVSRAIGVSPWSWWADVPVRTREALHVKSDGQRVGPPAESSRASTRIDIPLATRRSGGSA